MIVAPSFLNADFDHLREEIESVSSAEWLHFDVMDGKFVPNETYDDKMLEQVSQWSEQFFDCHLMIERPEDHIEDYAEAGADLITFHYEATDAPVDGLIDKIHAFGIKAGLSIKPKTDVEVLRPYLDRLDLILIMSVEPGEGGQSFKPNMLEKVRSLAAYREANGLDYLLEIDGGINDETAPKVREAGIDVIVVGSHIFGQKDRKAVIEALENA